MDQTRREFLKNGLSLPALFAFGSAVPPFVWQTACAAGTERSKHDGTILVVMQLSGGNDGLNTVIPYENDVYAKSRPTLRFTEREVHKLGDSGLGFHPRMEAFLRLYDAGLLSVVQGVGYPHPSREHARAMRDWQTALPNDADTQIGWLGRAIEGADSVAQSDIPATSVGRTQLPLALQAEHVVIPAVRSLQDWTFRSLGTGSSDGQRAFLQRVSKADAAAQNGLLNFVRHGTLAACTTSEKVDAVLNGGKRRSNVTYPAFAGAQHLQAIANLIRADVGTHIFFTDLAGGGFGGFDNHANQRGNHGALLHQLAESVAVFLEDLKQDRLLDRVVLMTFSEFGRTVSENGRHGTGHGAAAPVFLAGGRLKPGLIGPHPSLTDLDNDALKHHTDFRQVYATVLEDWLHINSHTALNGHFSKLKLFPT